MTAHVEQWEFQAEARNLTVRDNGIGTTHAEVVGRYLLLDVHRGRQDRDAYPQSKR